MALWILHFGRRHKKRVSAGLGREGGHATGRGEPWLLPPPLAQKALVTVTAPFLPPTILTGVWLYLVAIGVFLSSALSDFLPYDSLE